MTSEEIAVALEDHLASMADLPPVAWLNEDEPNIPPGNGAPYLILTLFRNRNLRVDIAGRYHIKQGIFQVTVATREGIGDRPADALADKIVAHFPADLKLGNLRVTELPSVGQGIPAEGEWRVPVSIYYKVL